MTSYTTLPTEARALIHNTGIQLAAVSNYTIATPAEYTEASNWLKAIKGKQKDLKEMRTSITKPMDVSKKQVLDLFRPAEENLAKAELLVKRAMITHQQAQERKRREAEAALQQAAIGEQNRRNALAETQAKKAEFRGDTDRAEAIRDNVPTIPLPTVESEVPKVQGLSTRTVWKHRVVDVTKVPREYLLVNDKMLAGVARSTKGMLEVAGVEFYSEEQLASGSERREDEPLIGNYYTGEKGRRRDGSIRW